MTQKIISLVEASVASRSHLLTIDDLKRHISGEEVGTKIVLN